MTTQTKPIKIAIMGECSSGKAALIEALERAEHKAEIVVCSPEDNLSPIEKDVCEKIKKNSEVLLTEKGGMIQQIGCIILPERKQKTGWKRPYKFHR